MTFETYQRELTKKCQSVEVIIDPVFEPREVMDPNNPNLKIYLVEYSMLGMDGIAVSNNLYKLIMCNTEEGMFYGSAF